MKYKDNMSILVMNTAIIQMSTWYFACDSDQHFSVKDNIVSQRKGDYIKTFTDINNNTKLDFLLCPGDMTDHSADDFTLFPTWFLKWLGRGPYGNECETYMEKWIGGIEKLGIPVYEGIGNHDMSKYYYPKLTMAKYVHKRHNATNGWLFKNYVGYYKFEHKGVDIIYTGLFPKNLGWIKANLPKDKTKPIIFAYHYNTMTAEDGSVWWSNKEKEAFYNVIKDYNVKLIINGHWHVNKVTMWKNIPNVVCAGNTPIVIKVEGDVFKVL